ncbi:amino acid transporter [Breznakia sp. PF5-3]|uniref:APC family permease n=1 Tax=unclassified Breznakia TaxID=2623764 RepID=UPI002406EC27|nr:MULTISPECIES: amino acid permease [unclassified Breznakia]MDF9825243.1 amino acid transporter [Breznakia sp. PM6-1]MDF9836115.1 amino acid transporter [Breznakia sp. PF5-3]MDF9838396.1 amino acid transporter [Breznakia sp. PFB2-8]MDF9860412.1 amino acid transporter [Breznakia sp. PH5-24]
MKESKKILWYNLAFMAFASVWSFGNVVNGFSEYNGLKAIVSWILMFALYFVPYALMVGEMGSAFKNLGGGVSSWIHETIGPRIAYYAGWTYWVVHMPYISQKPQSALIALSWAITGSATYVNDMNPLLLQIGCLLVFLIFVLISTRGINPLKNIATIAGSSMFVMSLLFIVLMMAAPAIAGDQIHSIDWSLDTFMPSFDGKFLTSLSILVFAVGGCERISPYVNKMKDPSKGFPKGMIFLAIMVAITAILGTIALGMMFDPNNIPEDLMMNGAYYAFQRLGEYYHVGNLFMIIYALCNVVGQLSVLIVSIDAPLRMLLDSADTNYIPKNMLKLNDKGVYINGIKLVTVIVAILIIVPGLLPGDVNAMFKSLIQLNSVTMPLRYLWVFVAYIALKRAGNKYKADYQFTKSKVLGLIAGIWCFAFTAFACLGGMFKGDLQHIALNVLTPFVLLGLGLILPAIARRQNGKKA